MEEAADLDMKKMSVLKKMFQHEIATKKYYFCVKLRTRKREQRASPSVVFRRASR